MSDRSHAAVPVVIVSVLAITAGIGMLAVTMPAPTATDDPATEREMPLSDGGDDEFTQLHRAGFTGQNVSVGVVDVTGFDTSSSELTGHVSATRSFATGSIQGNDGSHGTATATVLARIAPEASLYLTRVDGVDSYRRAVTWLRQQSVDVIVAPIAFYGQPGDGTGPVAQIARRATEDGIVFVTPAGNLAQSHWQGEYSADRVRDGAIQFQGADRRNAIRGGTNVTLWLSWERSHAEEEYTAELYSTTGNSTQLVARSKPYRGDDVPNERIVADVSPGEYFVVIRGPTRPTDARLRLVSPTHAFEYSTPDGSLVGPSTARDVVAVGAYNTRIDRLEPFSSRGPTIDGRTGVDVVAPDRRFARLSKHGFIGSSAAVPYVGGTAALVRGADPSMSPRHVELLLELTTDDVGRPGIDYATGHGELDPVAAVRAAANRTKANESTSG